MKHDLAEKDYSAFVKISEHREEKEKKPFTREEIKVLWQNLDWTFKGSKKTILEGIKVADIILILIHTGMRIDELLNLKAEDVHIAERYIKVNGTKTNNAARLVPIHKNIIPLLEARLATGTENLIADLQGQKVEYSNFRSPAYRDFCIATNMEHSIHETRHTFATYTTKMDSTLRAFIIGHSTNNLTNDVYTHPEVLLPELIAEIDKIEF
jgi:integrase